MAACALGNVEILELLLNTIKRRESLSENMDPSSTSYFQSYSDSLELPDQLGLTPFLIAAKYGHKNICKYLQEVSPDPKKCIQAVCEYEQNALHYAMISKPHLKYFS